MNKNCLEIYQNLPYSVNEYLCLVSPKSFQLIDIYDFSMIISLLNHRHLCNLYASLMLTIIFTAFFKTKNPRQK